MVDRDIDLGVLALESSAVITGQLSVDGLPLEAAARSNLLIRLVSSTNPVAAATQPNQQPIPVRLQRMEVSPRTSPMVLSPRHLARRRRQQQARDGGRRGDRVRFDSRSRLVVARLKRIPIRMLFNISSLIMVALAVILTGKALHAFQEVDVLSVTLSPFAFHSDWLGIYPTRETLVAQIVILGLSVFLWMYGKRPV